MGPIKYEVLLVVAGLTFYKTRFGFVIKPTAWKKFFVGYRFASYNCAIKFKQKKIDLNVYINGSHLNLIEGSSTLLGLGIPPSNHPTKLRSGWVGMGD